MAQRPALMVRTPQPANALLAAEQIKDVRQNRRVRGQLNDLAIRERVEALDEASRARTMQEAQIFGRAFNGVTDQAGYQRAVQAVAPFANVGQLPTTYSPDVVDRLVRTAEILAPPAEDEGFTLSPGQTRFGPGGTVLASVPTAETDDPARNFRDANALRDEFIKQTNDFAAAQAGFAKVQAAANDQSPAGDLAMIFGFMKVLDPTSVVREGEQATAQNTAGVPGQIRNLYNRVLTGERLTPEQRRNFTNTAQNQIRALQPAYDQTTAEYTRLANQFGLEPANVIVNRVVGSGGGTVESVRLTSGDTGGAVGQDISSMTIEQLNALDPATLSDAELLAAQQRAQELSRARR